MKRSDAVVFHAQKTVREWYIGSITLQDNHVDSFMYTLYIFGAWDVMSRTSFGHQIMVWNREMRISICHNEALLGSYSNSICNTKTRHAETKKAALFLRRT